MSDESEAPQAVDAAVPDASPFAAPDASATAAPDASAVAAPDASSVTAPDASATAASDASPATSPDDASADAENRRALTRRQLLLAAGGAAAVLIAGGAGWAATSTAAGHTAADADPLGLARTLGGEAPVNPAAAGGATEAAEAQGLHARQLTLEELPWNLQLINAQHPLPEGYKAPERKSLSEAGQAVDARIHSSLTALLSAAKKYGVHPVVCSSYRTHKRQAQLHERRVKQCLREGMGAEEAEREASFWVAPPGASEHEAALAVDLVDEDYQELDEKQETTAAQKWLMKHCAEYGFILRYPTEKSAVTGIGYEPWHYRYVGPHYAQAITESGLCLEEWLDQYLGQS